MHALVLALALSVQQKTFQIQTAGLPAGAPFNDSPTDNVDLADVDLDGDLDAAFADGGNFTNDQNRLWINLGGLQGGSVGVFQDETAQRMPSVLDDSRDLDFVDADADGDPDLYVSNTSSIADQSSRWLINVGGLQGATAGFFVDQTASRWLELGLNDGVTTHSSLPASAVLSSGGFIDWSCDCVFADLDNDGDPDLVHSSYGAAFGGKAPTRLFLNDGSGHYREFNPSGAQLVTFGIPDLTPGLWCEGVHVNTTTDSSGAQCDIADTPMSVDIADIDGDLDVDIFSSSRFDVARLYVNRSEENGGALSFRDETFQVVSQNGVGGGNYDIEFGDLDNDGDLDFYGLNWGISGAPHDDLVGLNAGGSFSSFKAVPNSAPDANEIDWIDFDADGDLDAYVAGSHSKLWRNAGAPTFALEDVTGQDLPAVNAGLIGVDVADADADGDDDLWAANENGPNVVYANVKAPDDTRAPLPLHVESAPDRQPSATPTVVRVHLHDNTSWTVMQYAPVVLEHSVDGGMWSSSPMSYSGGQVFRGEIPGTLSGVVGYRVRAKDAHGNVGVSAPDGYAAGASCSGSIHTYCTAMVHSEGCAPKLSGIGQPSLSQPGAFKVHASRLKTKAKGVLLYSVVGPASLPFFGGTLCVAAPFTRSAPFQSGGLSPCTGAADFPFDVLLAAPAAKKYWPGQTLWCQVWMRDSGAPSQVSLSGGLSFQMCP